MSIYDYSFILSFIAVFILGASAMFSSSNATQDIDIKKIFKSKLYKLMTDNKYKLINIVNSDLVFYRKKNDKRYRIYN